MTAAAANERRCGWGWLAPVIGLLALGAGPAPVVAADLQWQVVTRGSTNELNRTVGRLAQEGYRVQAVVADTPTATIVLARVNLGLRKNKAVAEYHVLDPRDEARVAALGAEGFRLRSVGKPQLGRAIAVFERTLGGTPSPHDYRSLQVAPGDDVLPALAAAAADGYRPIASLGDSGSEWVLLERAAGPREVRVLSAENVSTLEASVNALASEGFECDAVWNRPPKGFGLFRGGTLTAAVSRRRGVTTAATRVSIDYGRAPEIGGQFLAVVPYRGRFAFVVRRTDETDYATREVEWSNAAPKNAWDEDPFLVTLRREWWKPIEAAWAITSANRMTHWIALERW